MQRSIQLTVLLILGTLILIGAYFLWYDKSFEKNSDIATNTFKNEEDVPLPPVPDISDLPEVVPNATNTSDRIVTPYIPPNTQVAEYKPLTFPDNTLDTSDWQTFRNEQYGFEVRYPKGWGVTLQTKVELEKSDPSVQYPETFYGRVILDSGVPYFSLYVDIYKESVIETILREEKKINEEFDTSVREWIRVNNTYGLWYPYHKTDISVEDYYDHGRYFLGNKTISFYARYLISSKNTNIVETKEFQQIILSFKSI
jgi:hypothetical protein